MNFKKHISIFLALFVLFVNSSASLVLHFCHDQVAYVSLEYQNKSTKDIAEEHNCCAIDDFSDIKKDCCSNHEIKAEKKIDYSLLKDFQFDFLAVTFVPYTEKFFDYSEEAFTKHENVSFYCDSHAPPLYKLYSQFIFYA